MAFLLSLIGGNDAADAARTAVTWSVFAVVVLPLGQIYWDDGPGQAWMLVLGVVWMFALLPVAVVVLSWSDC